MEPTTDLETDEDLKEKMSEEDADSSSKHLKVDSLSGSLHPSRKNSSTHLEIRKATLMEQESLLEKVLKGDISDDDDDSMSAMDELARQKRLQKKKLFFFLKKKELIITQWEVIDTEDNGDVDVNEWKKGMKKLKASLTEEQMETLFNLLDEEKVGFVDRQTYQTFQPLIRLARRLNRQRKEKEDEDDNENNEEGDDEDGAKSQKKDKNKQDENEEEEEEEEDEELAAMRQQLKKRKRSKSTTDTATRQRRNETFNKHLKNGSSQNDTGSVVVHNSAMASSTQLSVVGIGLFGSDQSHDKSASNLLNPKNFSAFDVVEADGLQKEMEAELKKQASALKLSLLKEKQYLQEIEEMANTKEDFLVPEKALNWTPEEVALWLDEMGMAKYGQHVVEDGVDGSILLNDVTKQVLLNDICVNPLHVGKILRAIDKLRKLNEAHLEIPYKDWGQLNEENKKLCKEMETAHQNMNNIHKQMRDLELEIGQLKLTAATATATAAATASASNNNNSNNNNNSSTVGLDINEEPINDTAKAKENTRADLENQIAIYKAELERVSREKIAMATATSGEISRLRTVIKVLQNEQNKPSRLNRLGNPMDSFAGALGYKKSK
ncbi:hypothetical protein RFI_09269 [Reticulomyxa filosa]|uniref:SAM domain-containing protein n=1 Tax=Reticulomyxa filosa TaxID=46433 RepID=X6NRB4_RETFI|nr:hypothetical protein RFI_09269 [Reticulomyxa filosa]|eukprot:ETO27862.1 hypothetical protein RFI_09269 [Reticulomyxa filosa]